MKTLDIYNGEHREITVATDLETIKIPGKSSALVKVAADAVFNQPEFFVQEIGAWYAKTSYCHTGADMEIYDADAE